MTDLILPAAADLPMDVLRRVSYLLPPSALENTRLASRSLRAASSPLLRRIYINSKHMMTDRGKSVSSSEQPLTSLSHLRIEFMLDAEYADGMLSSVCRAPSLSPTATISAIEMLQCLNPRLPALTSLHLCGSLISLERLTDAMQMQVLRFECLSHVHLECISEYAAPTAVKQLAACSAIMKQLSALPCLTSLNLALVHHAKSSIAEKRLKAASSVLSNISPYVDCEGQAFTPTLAFPRLESLTWTTITIAAAELSAGCRNLTSLNLSACSRSGASLQRVCSALCPFTCLLRLALPKFLGYNSTDLPFTTLLAALPHLSSLSAPGFTFISDDLGMLVPHQLTQLSELCCENLQQPLAFDEDEEPILPPVLFSHSLLNLRILTLQPSEDTLPIPKLAAGLTSLNLIGNGSSEFWSLFHGDLTGQGGLPHLSSLTISDVNFMAIDCPAACATVKRLKLLISPYRRCARQAYV